MKIKVSMKVLIDSDDFYGVKKDIDSFKNKWNIVEGTPQIRCISSYYTNKKFLKLKKKEGY